MVIQKLRFVRCQVCRQSGTPGDLTGGDGGSSGGAVAPAEEVSCERVQFSRRAVTRAVETDSRAGVRRSRVEMSIKWSAGLT